VDPYTFSSDSVFTNLAPGDYWIYMKDANGCDAATYISIIAPVQLTASGSVISDYNGRHVSCYNSSDGSMSVMASDGVSPYQYKLDGPVSYAYGSVTGNPDTFSNLSPGVYTITTMDANGCTATSTVEVENTPLLSTTAIASPSTTSCFFTNDGAITADSTGGTGAMQYKLDFLGNPFIGYQSSDLFDSLYSGDYIVTVQDANGCTATTSVVITQPDALAVTAEVTDLNGYGVSCNTSTDGTITASGSGGVGGYTYAIDNGVDPYTFSSDSVFTNLAPGDYWIYMKDANGCDAAAYVSITVPDPLSFDALTVTDNTCFFQLDGTITNITASGGAPAYAYSWTSLNGNDGPQASNSFTNLSFGVYTVMVTDANGCTVTSTTEILTPDALALVVGAVNNETSSGANDGSITGLSGTGGTGSYSYSIDGSTFTTDTFFINLAPDGYFVYIKDDNGCIATEYVNIDPGPKGQSLIPAVSDATLHVYPNPTSDFINVKLIVKEGGNVVMKLVDMSGRTVKMLKGEIVEGVNYLSLDVNDLASGVYSLQVIRNDELMETVRVVKKHE